MKTMLLSFKDDATREAFLSKLKSLKDEMVDAAIETLRFDPAVKSLDERHAALWVSGTRIMEGPLPQVERMFKQECASHNAKVEIREYKNGDWQRVKIRTKA